MAAPIKKQGKSIPQVKTVPVAKAVLFSFTYKTKCIILACVCFLFYGNSILNKYALDDDLTIISNGYVQMGFAGISKILTNDSYATYYTSMGGDPNKQLSGGRFRPLSEIIFAIEQQFFGDSEMLPYIRHFVSVLVYMACILSIFYFLEKFLFKKIPGGSDMAFLATFLFAIHPIHTEVVANIKSLDETSSMLFIMLTFINGLRYLRGKQAKHLLFGTGSFLLALLSKEYAVTLLFFIPFMFYLLEDKKPVPALIASLPYFGVFLVYLLLRGNAVGFHNSPPSPNVLINPYYYATHMQRIATEWFVLGKYVGLLLFPYPLSCDYSYYQITYHSFTDITVLLSIIIYSGIFVWGIMLALKKDILSFAAFFFLFNILMISNFVLDIGATMGERLVFHSSLGLVIVLSYYLFKGISKMPLQTKRNLVMGIASVVGVVCFGETVVRNAQWKDDTSLFIHDVGVVPNSFLANSNAAGGYLKISERQGNTIDQAKSYLDSVKKYSFRALHFFPNLDAAYNKLGGVYLHLGLFDSAEYYWDLAEKYHPNYAVLKGNYALLSQMYFSKGIEIGKSGNPRLGVIYMRKALLHDSTNADIWYNIGGAYFTIQQYDSARYAWMKTLQYQPGNADAKRGLSAIASVKKN
jgi:protein O-mannosyl-transferase